MNLIQVIFEYVFIITQLIIAFFSIHYIYIILRRLILSKNTLDTNDLDFSTNPYSINEFVTVQIPVYNEKHVMRKLIKSLSELDYPPNLFEIQLLDDSIDETSSIINNEIRKYPSINFVHVRRNNRKGYKAGALNYGLKIAKGNFFAIFDTDFLPPRYFLQETIYHFRKNPHLGLIQTRWGHTNKEHSLLTKTISLGIDNHFLVEQPVRNVIGVMNFNGTCGVWRKDCIIDAGGWDENILAEDLDLSYRAYIKGWKTKYFESIVCNGEIPNSISSYKQQQYRWAKGTSQSARKNIFHIFTSNLTKNQKIESIFHHFGYFIQVCIFINLISMIPLLYFSSSVLTSTWELFFFIINLIASSMYLFTTIKLKMSHSQTITSIILLMLISIGISWKITVASIVGLLKKSGEFKRTPKGLTKVKNDYFIFFKNDLLVELFIICYILLGIFFAVIREIYLPIFYLLFCLTGLLMIFSYQIIEIFQFDSQKYWITKSLKWVHRVLN